VSWWAGDDFVMSENDEAHSGLFDALKRFSRTAAALAQNRLELLLVEWQEERARLCGLLLLAATAIVCGLMALIVLTFTLVVVFWDEHPIAILACLGVAYAAGAALAFLELRSRLARSDAFTATLAEFKKDRTWLDEQTATPGNSANKP
jgi:uncharacterized membrane protein YqjE